MHMAMITGELMFPSFHVMYFRNEQVGATYCTMIYEGVSKSFRTESVTK